MGYGGVTVDRTAGARVDGAMREFMHYFRALVAALGDAPGWYGVFAHRDPDGVQAYLDGTDVPPWDVVRAVLHDVAAHRGLPVDAELAARAQRLHAAAVAELDGAPGSDTALRASLDGMLRQRQYAAARERQIAGAVQQGDHGPLESERLANDLAWARDDRERAAARCTELQARLDAVESRFADPRPLLDHWFHAEPVQPAHRPVAAQAADQQPEPYVPQQRPQPAPDPDPAEPEPARRKRAPKQRGGARYGGARFAGAPEDTEVPQAPAAPAAVPEPGTPGLRGARFAGAVADEPQNRKEERRAAQARAERERLEEAGRTAARLAELRRTGRSGEAYVLISETAAGPAESVPLLAAALEQAGHTADVATLLWEIGSQPPAQLAAAAVALARGGRPDDCRTLLHQAAARPAADVAATAATLRDAGHRQEAVTLLAALIRARTAEDAVEIVYERHDLAGPLLAAARLLSVSMSRDVAAVLRRAGLPDQET